MSPMKFLYIFLLISSSNYILCAKCYGTPPPLVPALYVFGDSLLDNGNNNLLPTLAKANYFPYGLNFPGGFPTGRFTNGKNLADFIADYLGLPYPPPRVSILRPKSLMGYNYASGSCGILPETGKFIGECLNFDEQIRMFEKTVKLQMASQFNDESQLSQHLAKSIFIFSVGNNDYINTYFGFIQTRHRYNPQQFASLLAHTLSQQLQKLYNLGARKMVVFELGPIGCIPSIVRGSKMNGKCDEEKNQFVKLFNTELGILLKNLTSTLQGSHFVLGHAHWLGYDAVMNPAKYGLIDSSNPCCEAWGNADYLGLPYPPPYIDPSRVFGAKTLTGYSYASGACGILSRTGSEIGLCLHLEEQIRLFEETVSKHLSSQLRNQTQLSKHLAKSIFVFSMGSNDYLGNYFGGISNNRQRYNPQQFTQILIDTLSQNLQKLYKLGARKVVVFGLAPLGCLESMVRKFKPKGRCAENVNQVVSNFNTQLSLVLKNLTYSLEDSHYIIGNTYSLAYDTIINPGNYGLSDSKNPCCKTWGNGTLPCIPFVKPCSNPSKHFFWDGSHPTEAFTSLLASRCIRGSYVCLPFNIHQLCQV